MERKFKIYVYAICKNEEQFVERFMDSVKDADGVYVLDTGSSDKTVNKLKKRGAVVKVQKFNPWRFDVARNESLNMVPLDADFCIALDLDEIMVDGWREKLEEKLTTDINRVKYMYYWKLDENDNPLVSFYSEKIHDRNSYIWHHPVHEVLKYKGAGNEKTTTIFELLVKHYPDDKKPRTDYLPLLELAVLEDPDDDRNMHYLGREYMYVGRYNEAIDTLIKHLKLPRATWKDERCASMRYIAKSYIHISRYDEAKFWLEKAIKEAPYLREPYYDLGLIYLKEEDDSSLIKVLEESLKIEKQPVTYINEAHCYNGTIEDILSISYYNKKEYLKSLKMAEKVIEYQPTNERVLKNIKIIKSLIK